MKDLKEITKDPQLLFAEAERLPVRLTLSQPMAELLAKAIAGSRTEQVTALYKALRKRLEGLPPQPESFLSGVITTEDHNAFLLNARYGQEDAPEGAHERREDASEDARESKEDAPKGAQETEEGTP
ncbi:MAG: hypothetical protein IJU05_00455 [Schwartzia sp.]|nr:hypothetical protein [Schwartzia sp. (in: firmicutes)]